MSCVLSCLFLRLVSLYYITYFTCFSLSPPADYAPDRACATLHLRLQRRVQLLKESNTRYLTLGVVAQDHFVQISELQRDGRLRNVVRKSDFGSRIRNAKVVGIGPDEDRDEADFSNIAVKTENDSDVVMKDADSNLSPELPPQMLLLVLESGDCVFLFLHTTRDGALGFESSSFSTSSHLKHPGFHLAVDPSSRYIALGCTENHFIVYELESADELRKQYSEQCVKHESDREPLKFIRKSCPRSVYGVINHVEFLHPRPADDYHIILLLIIVKNGMSRMVTFDWEAAEEDLKDVLRQEKNGYRLPAEHQIPILLIPLKVRTAFLAISPNSIAVCKDVLQGPPEFEDFRIQDHETSEFHHGIYEPLWTAWTRPYRLPSAHATRDFIYLAREDGVVTYLEIDSENIPGATSKILKSECNISTAFCSLFDRYSDILIIGGDSGPGTIWQVSLYSFAQDRRDLTEPDSGPAATEARSYGDVAELVPCS